MMYEIQTEKFGVLQVEADSIRAAREVARRFGVKHPSSTRRQVHYRHCERCDSRPCTCVVARPIIGVGTETEP